MTFIGPKRRRTLRNLLVDTGATFSVAAESMLKDIGVPLTPGALRLKLGDGRSVRVRAGTVRVRLGRRESFATVVTFPGAQSVVGAETLEGLGLDVDVRHRKLVPNRPTAHALYFGTTPFSGRR